jgi:hypothetical protein
VQRDYAILKRWNNATFTKSSSNENIAAATSRPATIAIARGRIRTPLMAKRLISVRSTAEEMMSHLPGRELHGRLVTDMV